jgi:3-dehydroquinate synthase
VPLTIKSKIRDYQVNFHLSPDFLGEFITRPNALFIIDENVWKNHQKGCLLEMGKAERKIFSVAEDKKTLESVQTLYDWIMVKSAKKNLSLFVIGGGILQDIAGFVASTLYRGVNWIFVPTTLLAQADSCIGAKTSLNYRKFKNLIGTFYPPLEVHIYVPFLKTLSGGDYDSGLGEMAKLHIMGGEKLVVAFMDALPDLRERSDGVLTKLIQNSLTIKKYYIEEDEFDIGRRNLLNYGHCFGHAIETATEYRLPHGQAVVLGMVLANKVAVRRNLLSREKENFLLQKVLKPVLNIDFKILKLDVVSIVDAMQKDKKRVGSGLALAMLKEDYSLVAVNDLIEVEAKEALAQL